MNGVVNHLFIRGFEYHRIYGFVNHRSLYMVLYIIVYMVLYTIVYQVHGFVHDRSLRLRIQSLDKKMFRFRCVCES